MTIIVREIGIHQNGLRQLGYIWDPLYKGTLFHTGDRYMCSSRLNIVTTPNNS